jgi:hypothetical protein
VGFNNNEITTTITEKTENRDFAEYLSISICF